MFEKLKKVFTKEPTIDKCYLVKSKPYYYGLGGATHSKVILYVDHNDSWDEWEFQQEFSELCKEGYYQVSEEQFNKLKGDICL